MAQLKKTMARWVLRGMCILGILIGFGFVYFPIAIIFPIPRDDIALLCIELLTSGFMLALGVILIRDSYLMLSAKAFGAIKDFSVLVAFTLFCSVVDPFSHFAAKWVNGIQAKTVVDLASFSAALILSVLVYLICVKLLKRLVEVAYGLEKISGAQNSGTERGENTNVEAT